MSMLTGGRASGKGNEGVSVSTAGSPVMVVVFEDQVSPSLARSALKNRWSVLDGRKRKGLLREIMFAQPKALILQIPETVGVAEAMIERLAQHWVPMVLMGIGGERRESEVRRAGIDCLLPSTAGQEMIESTVGAMNANVKEVRN